MKYTIQAKIKDNKLQFLNPNALSLALSSLKFKSKPETKLKVVFQRDVKRRTQGAANEASNQNGLYWLYLQVIEAETGNFADDLHEYFKRKFLTPRDLNIFNDKIKVPGSTAVLNKVDFSEYMNKIEALTGIPIPSEDLII